jgi:hypothetical protein
MTQPPKPPDDDDEKLARAFAKGLKYYEADKAEEEAKLNASKDGDKGGNGDGDNAPKRSWKERLLG